MSLAAQAISLALPCFPCGLDKAPFTKGGFKQATRDPTGIIRAFADPRAKMIGVPTGHVSGLLVIDIDVADGKPGQAWYDDHEMARTTREHRTRSGGRHLLFAPPAGRDIRNSAGKIAPGVDVRGGGGYIIHPPSPGYEVSYGGPIARLPDWLLRVLDPPKAPRSARPIAEAGDDQARRALLRSVDVVARAMEGGRNDQLNRQAFILGMYVGAGLLDLSDVASNLYHAAKGAGLTDTEIKATLRSGLAAGRTKSVPRGR